MFDKEGTALAPFFCLKVYSLVLTYRLPSSETEEGKTEPLMMQYRHCLLSKEMRNNGRCKKTELVYWGFQLGGILLPALYPVLTGTGKVNVQTLLDLSTRLYQ